MSNDDSKVKFSEEKVKFPTYQALRKEAICKEAGHQKPLLQKLHCKVCPRCKIVVED